MTVDASGQRAEALFERRRRLIAAAELDALMSLYHDHALLLRLDRELRGREALRDYFSAWLARGPQIEHVIALRCAGDLVAYQAQVITADGESYRIHGTLRLVGERVAEETFGLFPELAASSARASGPTIELEPYERWTPSAPVPDPRVAGRETIGPIMLAIIATEGPILAERAYRLYLKASGGKALTSIARAPLSGSIYRLLKVGAIELDEGPDAEILRPFGSAAVRVRELGGRALDEVPTSELQALMTSLSAAGCADDDLPRAVLDAYGLVRMTAKAEALLTTARDSRTAI